MRYLKGFNESSIGDDEIDTSQILEFFLPLIDDGWSVEVFPQGAESLIVSIRKPQSTKFYITDISDELFRFVDYYRHMIAVTLYYTFYGTIKKEKFYCREQGGNVIFRNQNLEKMDDKWPTISSVELVFRKKFLSQQ